MLTLFIPRDRNLDYMRKGISPLLATVILIALTISVAALLGSWFTSTTRMQTEVIEENMKQQVNCSSALLDIADILCSNDTQKLQIAVINLGDIPLYGFSVIATINETFYSNNTGGPNSTDPLNPGEQVVLTYFCDRTQYCTDDSKITEVYLSPSNCPQAYMKKKPSVTC